jgi:nucleotide-binding universal stress UspA family protein
MIRSVLIGVDGSPGSLAAIDWGMEWCGGQGALLVGLGVVPEPEIVGGQAVPLGGMAFKPERDASLLAAARRDVEQVLDAFVRRCAAAQMPCKPLEDAGLPDEQVAREAQRYDLIVLGLGSLFDAGSSPGGHTVLKRLVRQSPRPIVVTPTQAAPRGPIVVAYDGSPPAARTLQRFQTLGLAQGREIHIVTVWSDRVEAARRADRAAEFLDFHGISARRHPVASSEPPARAILDYLRDVQASLVVMGAFGQSGWRDFLFGSVTQDLLDSGGPPMFLDH